jgi:hypothetical protein
MHHAVPDADRVQLRLDPKILITGSAIRNRPNPLNTKDRHAF